MRPTCIVSDFDYTLAHPKGDKRDLFNIFVQRGLPEQRVTTAYEEVKKKGFIPSQLIRALHLDLEVLLHGACSQVEHELEIECDQWAAKSFELYPEVQKVFEQWRKRQFPIAIVTFGHPAFQARKLKLVGLPYDTLFVVSSPEEKIIVARRVVRESGLPVVAINDKSRELDDLDAEGLVRPHVIAIKMDRADSPYLNEPERFQHIHVRTLEEADALIRSL